MRKIIETLYGGILYVISAVLVLYTIVYFRILSVSYLMERYLRNDKILTRFGMSEADLRALTGELLGMMKGKWQEISFTIMSNGEQVSFINEKETRHLQEIARLIGHCNLVMAGLLLLLIAGILLLWKKKRMDTLAEGVYVGLLLLVCTGGICVFLSTRNLSGWIDGFHHVFFRGDNWILNPATDRLIYLCPNSLFQDVIHTLLWSMSLYFSISLLAAVVVSIRKYKKK